MTATHRVLDLPTALGSRISLDELLERIMQGVHCLVRERRVVVLGQITGSRCAGWPSVN